MAEKSLQHRYEVYLRRIPWFEPHNVRETRPQGALLESNSRGALGEKLNPGIIE
jgi:hypothetical protein